MDDTFVEDYILEHFGTKGMRWGVRKSSSSVSTPAEKKARLAVIQKKLSRKNAEQIYGGAGLVGWSQTKKLSFGPAMKHPYAKTQARIATRGIIETAAILAGGNFVLNRVAASPKAIQGAKVSGLILVASGGVAPKLKEMHSVEVYRQANKLWAEQRALEKDLGINQRKKRG